MSPADRQQPHRRCTNPACAVGHAHCETCGAGSGWPCPPVAAAERAVVEAQADAALDRALAALGAHIDRLPRRRRRLPVLTATTEGSTR